MLFGVEAAYLRAPETTGPATEPMNLAQTTEEPALEATAAADPNAVSQSVAPAVIPDASATACRPKKCDSDSSSLDCKDIFGKATSFENEFTKYKLPHRKIGTSNTVTSSRGRASNQSRTVQCKPDEIRSDHSVTLGKGNGFSHTRGSNAALKRKIFRIGGKITITESSEGCSGEGSINKNGNAATSQTNSVTYYKSAKGCGKCKGKDSGKDSDSCDDIGASRSVASDAGVAAPVVTPTTTVAAV